jgi:prepilin-type N-terminal cleavage/methylation domain-containing protein
MGRDRKKLEGLMGFTLVELVIVVIVVAVLAGIAIPLYQVMPERSEATEAVATLGMVRQAMREYHAEFGTYENANFTDCARVTAGGTLGLSDGFLLGRYFSSACYTFDGAPTAGEFRISCDGSSSIAPYASEVARVVCTIDEAGEITTSGW